MARINLLPWRAEHRKLREREFYGMLGAAAVVGVVLSVLIWFYYDQQVSGQNERNRYLETQIEEVKAKNKEIDELDKQRDRLLARKKVIEELQANRSQMVHLFDSLVRTIPDGVVLTSLKQEGQVLTLEGRSQSNARVSAYMRNLEGSGWMTKPDLSIIEAKAQEKSKNSPALNTRALPYTFTLKVTLANPADSEDEGTEEKGGMDDKKKAGPAAPPGKVPAKEEAKAPQDHPAADKPAPAKPAPAPAKPHGQEATS